MVSTSSQVSEYKFYEALKCSLIIINIVQIRMIVPSLAIFSNFSISETFEIIKLVILTKIELLILYSIDILLKGKKSITMKYRDKNIDNRI